MLLLNLDKFIRELIHYSKLAKNESDSRLEGRNIVETGLGIPKSSIIHSAGILYLIDLFVALKL